MDWSAVQIGVMEIVISGIIGLAVVYGSYLLFNQLTPDLDEEKEIREDNKAVAISMGGNLLAIALIMREALYPITATVQDLVDSTKSISGLLKAFGYSSLYLTITAIASFITVILTLRCFTKLTRNLNEQAEIAKGNIAAAIFYSAVVIAIAIFVAEGAGNLTRALIPSPPLISSANISTTLPNDRPLNFVQHDDGAK